MNDLSSYQDGRSISCDVLEGFVVTLELVYRELHALDDTYGLVRDELVGRELIRTALQLLKELQEKVELTDSMETPNIVLTGAQGRPRYALSRHQLQYLVESGFTGPQIADIVGVSLSTIRRRLSEFGIAIASQYAPLTTTELTTLVREIQLQFPKCGNRQMQGHLLARGYRVQQERVREVQRMIDPEGSIMRQLRVTMRREYRVPAPRSLWHIDGNHKLIQYISGIACCLLLY